jgi:hypothetical protein
VKQLILDMYTYLLWLARITIVNSFNNFNYIDLLWLLLNVTHNIIINMQLYCLKLFHIILNVIAIFDECTSVKFQL